MAAVSHHQQDTTCGVSTEKEPGHDEEAFPPPADAQDEKWISDSNPPRRIVPRRWDSVISYEDSSLAGQVLSLINQSRMSQSSHRNSSMESTLHLPNLTFPASTKVQVIEKPAPVRKLKGRPKTASWEDIDLDNDDPDRPTAQAATASQQGGEPQIFSQHTQPHDREELVSITFPSTQLPLRERKIDVDGSLVKRGKIKILSNKYCMHFGQVSFNGFLIFSTWWWTRYYYISLPLITATVALNVAMIVALIFRKTWNTFCPEQTVKPQKPESMVFLIPCYNETKEELLNSLDSLVAQKKIEQHEHAIIIICDGKVRGPGMEKTTADYLVQDILTYHTERKYISSAYTAWDQQPMDVVIQKGKYGGIPYLCIIKQQNQGKRDSLVLVRSFLYNFNRRHGHPHTICYPLFFNEMCKFMVEDAQIERCEHLIGMDADTVFADECIYYLLEESRYPHTVGVCGYVAVNWKDSNWNLWRLYQSCEYTVAQTLRRLHQSMVTHKVSCLPGCCQLLKVCEETCGDHVLIELFGYCPVATDNLLKQIRATASEDRNHVCHMLIAHPKAQTRQALRAKAFTDVPSSWSVFLSQRRRWTLGATSNDLLLFFGRGVQWFERIVAGVNVITWLLNPFIIASLACFIFSFLHVAAWLIMCFVSVMLIPIVYCFFIPVWLTRSWKPCLQFWIGFFMYVACGPFLSFSVLVYASIYMDSFGWGKTRKVISDDESQSGHQNELERLEQSEKPRTSTSEDASSPATSAVVNANHYTSSNSDNKNRFTEV